jgi:hypothetical protein
MEFFNRIDPMLTVANGRFRATQSAIGEGLHEGVW